MESRSPLVVVGRTVLLDLSDTFEVAGTVAWKTGDRIGVEFLAQISPEILSRALTPNGETLTNDLALRDGFGRQLPPLGANLRLL